MSALEDEILIAVMGVTGAGKSTFIRNVSGRNDVRVGHTLESATEEVVPYPFLLGGYKFTLIDTPGFDDSRYTDDVIVERLLEWLKCSAKRNKKLSGIIYMHRIVDPRIQGTARASMSMFRRLCGPNYFENVVLGTTFWNHIEISEGARREQELCDNDDFWGLLSKKGSRVCRIGYSTRDDQKLLFQMAKNNRGLIQAQEEMMAGVDSSQTAAAQEVKRNLADWARIYEEKIEEERTRLQRELNEANRRRRHDINTRKAAIEADERRQENKRLLEQERAKLERKTKLDAQQAYQTRQQEEFEKKLTELQRQRVLNEQRDARIGEKGRVRCRRVPVREIKCDKCKKHVNTKRSPFYHCCRCLSGGKSDNYDQCMNCGSRCKDLNHGVMVVCNQ